MRHRYMESLLIRAAMQQDLMSTVKSNMAYQQLEKAESKARQEEQRAARLEELANERKAQKEQAHMSKVLRLERARAKADRCDPRRRGRVRTRAGTSGGRRSSRTSASSACRM